MMEVSWLNWKIFNSQTFAIRSPKAYRAQFHSLQQK